MKKTTYRLAIILIAASLCLTGFSFAGETDDRIESTAKQSYVFKTYLADDDVKIDSKDGAVTLTGTVSEESKKSLAEGTVASLPGVANVDNQLEVKKETPAAYSDTWLIAKVKSALLYHRNVSGIGTEVLAKNGAITLRGEAENQAQKDLTTEYAMDVEGVKRVNNEMTILPAAQKSGEKTTGEIIDDIGESIDDASITAMVKSTLLYHRSTSGIKTTVETKDGVVTLTGKASSAAEKALATKYVSDVRGVKEVVNNMTIEQAKPKAS